MVQINEALRNVVTTATKSLEREFPKTFQTKEMRTELNEMFTGLEGEITKIISTGKFKPEEILTELMTNSEGKFYETVSGSYDKLLKVSTDISTSVLSELNKNKTQPSPNNTGTNFPLNTNTGTITVLGQTGVNPNFNRGAFPTVPQKPVEVDGDIDVNVKFQNLPTGLTPEQIAEVIKTFNMAVNEQAFKNYIININRGESAFGPNQMATF